MVLEYNKTRRNFAKYSTHGTSLNRNVGHSGRRRTVRSLNNINTVLEALRRDPRISARRNTTGLSRATFNRITKLDLNWHPYTINIRHELFPQDPARRLAFCTWLMERNAHFWPNLVIGDEASFQMNACVSSRNVLEYAPRGYPPMNNNYRLPDSRQKWTVWVGLCGNGEVVGPLFFPGNVNGEAYLDMLNNNVVPILSQHYEVQANGAFRRVWWAQDGAPAHRRIIVRDRLQELFRNRVIAFGQPREWPPRSPDLPPCDFFLWGYLKSRVYQTPPQNLENIRNRITAEVHSLPRDMVRRAVLNMEIRARLCIERNGAHIKGR